MYCTIKARCSAKKNSATRESCGATLLHPRGADALPPASRVPSPEWQQGGRPVPTEGGPRQASHPSPATDGVAAAAGGRTPGTPFRLPLASRVGIGTAAAVDASMRRSAEPTRRGRGRGCVYGGRGRGQGPVHGGRVRGQGRVHGG